MRRRKEPMNPVSVFARPRDEVFLSDMTSRSIQTGVYKIMSKNISYRLTCLFATVFLIGTAGWGRKFHLAVTPLAPTAWCDIDAHQDKHGVTQVDLKARNLAKPSELEPPAATYVVWFQQRDSAPQNVGELSVGDDLKGQFRVTTPYQTFDVIVTAERDPQAKTPSEQAVLLTTIHE
jgi:hypothetical protein